LSETNSDINTERVRRTEHPISFDCSKASSHVDDPLPTKVGKKETRPVYRTTFEVWKISGGCPIYREGDRIVFDDDLINEEESNFVCKLAVSSFSTRYAWFRGSDVAADRMIEDGDAWLACPAPGPPYTKHGRVIFRGSRVPVAGIAK